MRGTNPRHRSHPHQDLYKTQYQHEENGPAEQKRSPEHIRPATRTQAQFAPFVAMQYPLQAPAVEDGYENQNEGADRQGGHGLIFIRDLEQQRRKVRHWEKHPITGKSS